MLSLLLSGLAGPDALLPERLRLHCISQDSKASHKLHADQQGCLRHSDIFNMQVYANDLNPRSFHYLDVNVKLNKVPSLSNNWPTPCWHTSSEMKLHGVDVPP